MKHWKQTTRDGWLKSAVGLLMLVGVFSLQLAPLPVLAKGKSGDAWGTVVKPSDPAKIIQMFDENGDGKIDREELSLYIVRFFNKLDKNDDAYLTPDEVPGMNKDNFSAIDKNNDGKLSAYEFVTAESLKFGNLDTNADGFIDAAEIAAYLKSRSG